MKLTLFILTFVISTGLSALGLISSYQLKKQENSFASSLFYYAIFLVAFGFYGIWSHLLFSYLFEDVLISDYNLPNLLGVFPILGIPLLIVAWYLFIQFCIELNSLKLPRWLSATYFLVLISGFFILGIYFKNQLSSETKINLTHLFRTLSFINLISLLIGAIILSQKNRKRKERDQSLINLWGILFLPFLFSSIALFMVSSHWIFVILAIMFYFSSIAILPMWLFYKTTDAPINTNMNFTDFCNRFEISKREADIIIEICKGKTNKEVADTLFITLQTVKDHAHRIYLKTNVSNRVQLSNLVNDSVNSGIIPK